MSLEKNLTCFWLQLSFCLEKLTNAEEQIYLVFLFKEFFWGVFLGVFLGLGFCFAFRNYIFQGFATNPFYKGREIRFSGDSHLILGLDCLITK